MHHHPFKRRLIVGKYILIERLAIYIYLAKIPKLYTCTYISFFTLLYSHIHKVIQLSVKCINYFDKGL